MQELWDIYNEQQEITGLKLERGKAIPQGFYHLVVSAWIVNSQGQYLLSQRHPNKSYPGYWECTGGSVLSGESSLLGAVREVEEELGIDLDANSGRLICRAKRDKEQDFYEVWLFHADIAIEELKLQKTEVVNAQWVDMETLREMFATKKLHPLIDYIDSIL